MIDFSELTVIPLSEIWAHEAKDFTPWLEENIQKLGDALGLELEVVEREAKVGDLLLDLHAKDIQSSQTVIIENQLKPADHKHLGQLLSYAAGMKASIVIWISEVVREEYREVLDWLNQITDPDIQFFAVVVEVVKIDESKPVLIFKPVVLPNEWQKSQKQTTREISPRHEKRQKYFQKLIDELREEHNFTGAKKAQTYTYHHFASGITGLLYGAMLRSDNRALVYVHIKEDVKGGRLEVYDKLHNLKDKFETKVDEPLEWIRDSDNENEFFSRIAISIDGSIDSDEVELERIRGWQIENLIKFNEVFHPEIKRVLESIES